MSFTSHYQITEMAEAKKLSSITVGLVVVIGVLVAVVAGMALKTIGPAGLEGPVGLQGNTGARGPQGSTAVVPGATGPIGPSGRQGPPGPPGAQGAYGPPAQINSVTVSGIAANLPANTITTGSGPYDIQFNLPIPYIPLINGINVTTLAPGATATGSIAQSQTAPFGATFNLGIPVGLVGATGPIGPVASMPSGAGVNGNLLQWSPTIDANGNYIATAIPGATATGPIVTLTQLVQSGTPATLPPGTFGIDCSGPVRISSATGPGGFALTTSGAASFTDVTVGGTITVGNTTLTSGELSLDNGAVVLTAGTATFGPAGLNYTFPSLSVTGNITAGGDITAFSDARLKTNVFQIEGALGKVLQMRGVNYNKIDTNQKSLGLIAQELEQIVPEAVCTDSAGLKSVAYGNLIGLLVEAIKEQQLIIEKLMK